MDNQLPEPEIRVVKQSGDVKIHAFISPEMFLSNATYVIEGPHELVIIDGQFVVPFALAFRGYIDSLGKPINRVYLSHEHPDHFFGVSAAFGDVPVHALPETIDFLKTHGEEIRKARQAVFGGFVPGSVVIPGHAVSAGKEVIDGITFELVPYEHGEVEHQLVVNLPDLGVSIVQDLLYSGAHVYIHDVNGMGGLLAILEGFKTGTYDSFLPGHGEPPAGKAEVQANIDYIKGAVRIARDSTDVATYKAALLAAYPDRKGAAIIDIYAPMLFPAAPTS
jgi:glyoxylase-like metal-dependent hydrolase (beta-lactamase superfamily II)